MYLSITKLNYFLNECSYIKAYRQYYSRVNVAAQCSYTFHLIDKYFLRELLCLCVCESHAPELYGRLPDRIRIVALDRHALLLLKVG